MDVDRDASVESGFGAVLEQGHGLDALIACAGWGLSGAVEQTSMTDARDQLETNFWGAVRVVQHALPVMRAQGHGRIVLISSIGGIVGLPFQAFYSASKFAMEGFGEALGYEVQPFNIEVTLVEPGNVRTEFTAKRRSTPARPGDDPYGLAVDKAIELDEQRRGQWSATRTGSSRRATSTRGQTSFPAGLGGQGRRTYRNPRQAPSALPAVREGCKRKPRRLINLAGVMAISVGFTIFAIAVAVVTGYRGWRQRVQVIIHSPAHRSPRDHFGESWKRKPASNQKREVLDGDNGDDPPIGPAGRSRMGGDVPR